MGGRSSSQESSFLLQEVGLEHNLIGGTELGATSAVSASKQAAVSVTCPQRSVSSPFSPEHFSWSERLGNRLVGDLRPKDKNLNLS